MLSLTVRTEGTLKEKLVKVYRDYRELGRHYVAVGWDANAGRYPDGQSVAQVAIFNEFGTRNANGSERNPERPFMRPAYHNNRPALDALRTKVVQQVTDGTLTPTKALDKLGYQMQLWIQAAIKSNPGPPLSSLANSKHKPPRPGTLERKRAAGRPAVTLIDTRRMLDTLTYKIYGGFLAQGQQSQAAKDLQKQSAFSSARLNAKAQERAQGMRSARQIKLEKQRLKDELKAALAKKKRADVRAAKKAKGLAKKAKITANKAFKKYKKAEARKTKYEKKIRAKNEKHARDAEKKATQRKRKQIKGTFAKAAKKARTMAARDKRQAKGLSRIRKLTPAQKVAKAAREKLQRANKARLATEKRAEKAEVRAEKKAKMQARSAAKKQKKAAKTAARNAKFAATKKAQADKRAAAKAKKQLARRYKPRTDTP